MTTGRGGGGTSGARIAAVVNVIAILCMLIVGGNDLARFFLGIGICLTAMIIGSTLATLIGTIARVRYTFLSIGIGPVLRRISTRQRTAVIRALPVCVTGFTPDDLAVSERDYRLSKALGLLMPLLLLPVASVLVPGRTVAVATFLALSGLGQVCARRPPGAARPLISRILRKATPASDPALACADRRQAATAALAAAQGDFTTAEDLLARLEADPEAAAVSAAIARTAILGARGRFAEACQVEHVDDPREGPAAREARLRGLDLDRARYLLYAAMADPSRDVDTDAYIRSYLIRYPLPGWGFNSGYDGEIRALDLLRHDTPAAAARLLRNTLRSSAAPLADADRLCTRALIRAAGGRRRRAAVLIERARRIAPCVSPSRADRPRDREAGGMAVPLAGIRRRARGRGAHAHLRRPVSLTEREYGPRSTVTAWSPTARPPPGTRHRG